MIELARRGLGLCVVPSGLVERELQRGRLIEVLKDWRLEAPNVYAIWPANAPRRGLSLRFVSFLEKHAR